MPLTEAQVGEVEALLRRFEGENRCKLSAKVLEFGTNKEQNIMDFGERGPVRVLMVDAAWGALGGEYKTLNAVAAKIKELGQAVGVCEDCEGSPPLVRDPATTAKMASCPKCKTLVIPTWAMTFVAVNGDIHVLQPLAVPARPKVVGKISFL